MTVYGLRIDPDGTVTPVEQIDVLAAARAELRECDVNTLRSPFTNDDTYIGIGADWARVEGEPLNVKAWALYGRSPICGPMYVALDSNEDGPALRDPLPEPFVSMLTSDDDWIGSRLRERMRHALRHEREHPTTYVTREGTTAVLAVPEWNGGD